ncbi:TetR/AcrR family transcriptional regulator [Clostridium scatologenes]|uniref:Transcriptional regulator n=1 Tax=Clostridium scatologenes TaxID=1548 RepID=A0A0E3K0T0_CLOSL|nr:TetR/AcrR family transcriptional regulator [Clostridium scatologenes]AKA69295.1 transcriptional regulator [Clostridium scatologenes]
MSNNLRDKIIDKSIELFNEEGYSNVKMRTISEELNISLGNLTYHFKRKKDLILSAIAKQYEEYKSLNFSTDVSMEELNQQFLSFDAFRKKYFFYFYSFTELSKEYPEISKIQIDVINEFYTYYNDIFSNFINKGIMKKELYPGQYEDLSTSLLLLNMYGAQEIILLKKFIKNQKNYLSILWSLILPNLTSKGMVLYDKLNLSK